MDPFQRRTSTVGSDKKSLIKSLQAIQTISAVERLDRHGPSAAIRIL